MVMRKRRPPPFARRATAAEAKPEGNAGHETTQPTHDAVNEEQDRAQTQTTLRRRKKPFVL